MSDGDIEVTERKDGVMDDKTSRRMWAKLMNKLQGFERDIAQSTDFYTSLVAESNLKITKFEKSFQPLTNTIEYA